MCGVDSCIFDKRDRQKRPIHSAHLKKNRAGDVTWKFTTVEFGLLLIIITVFTTRFYAPVKKNLRNLQWSTGSVPRVEIYFFPGVGNSPYRVRGVFGAFTPKAPVSILDPVINIDDDFSAAPHDCHAGTQTRGTFVGAAGARA